MHGLLIGYIFITSIHSCSRPAAEHGTLELRPFTNLKLHEQHDTCTLHDMIHRLPSISQRVGTRLMSSQDLGLILRSACYSAGLGLILSPKFSLKLGRVL